MRKLLSVLFSTLQGGVRRGLLFVALLTTTCLWAYDFQSGDLYYNITNDTVSPYTVEVTYKAQWSSSNYSGITTAVIPETITYNGTTYSVTSIGDYAFYWCESLTSITIPESVTSIGDDAFYGCSSLTSISIPESVTNIGNRTFYSCSSLTSISIPESVTSIGDYAFYLCESLTSITIPNSVTSIGNYALQDCSSLTSITIPNSVITIGYSAFSNCSSLIKTNYTGDIAGWCKIKFKDASANPISNSHNLYINNQEIKDLVIPDAVDSIQNYAFYECFFLNSVTIPSGVQSIGYNTFQNCCFLKQDFVNNSSLDAEENAYWGALVGESEIEGLIIQGTTVVGCRKNVTTVTIPNDITNIGGAAFKGCSSLIKTNYTGDIAGWCAIKFGDSYANPIYYSHNLYINNQEIKDLGIPNTVDSIHDYAFSGCSSLTSLTIPNSVTSIGNRAFLRCTSLTSVTIGNSVTSIGDYAFYHCSSLISISLPESVTNIGNSAFHDCESLTSITIPENVTSIGTNAFYNSGIYNDRFNWENNVLFIDNCIVATKEWIDGNYTIKDGVRLIAAGAFRSQSALTEVVFPNSVKYICKEAFWGLRSLLSVTLGSGLTCIEDRVFDGCTALASINIPQGVSSVGKWAFRNCSSLDTIFLTSQIPPTLDSTAFQNAAQPICYVPCGTLAEYQASSWVNYVDTLVEVCDNELFYTSTDGAIVTPDNTAFGAKIVDNTYSNGQGVITFDRPITTLGRYAFYACENLASIIIPETITEIGNYAFKYCSALSSIIIPNTVIEIGYDAFYACSSLTSITIPNSVTSIGEETFYACSSLTEVNIPNNVTRIEENTFSGCSALTEIAIPNSVTYIGESAFEDCVRLGKVQIGSGVETIAENAFVGCTRLYDVYCYATYPPFAEQSSFANYNVYLYVPCESIRNYTLDVVWGNFKFIECIESEDVNTEGVVVTPSTNDVTITWPTEAGADSYIIVIKKGDTVFCTLTFNADGQLLNIAFAPGRDGNHPAQYAEQAGNGYRFTVTGLEEGTHYTYNIDVKNAANNTIMSHSGEFTTESTTPVENTHTSSPMTNCKKIIRDNQLLILRDGNTYNVMGVIVE